MSSPSSDVAAVLRLGPLFPCCIADPFVVSSRVSVDLLYQYCLCLVHDNRVPCELQRWQGGHPSAGGVQLLPGPTNALGPLL
jgi:hypothetical protein